MHYTENLYAFHNDPESLVGYEYRMQIPQFAYNRVVVAMYSKYMDDHEKRAYMKRFKETFAKDTQIAYAIAKLYHEKFDEYYWEPGSEQELDILRAENAFTYVQRVIGADINRPKYADILTKLDPKRTAELFARTISSGQQFDQSYENKIIDYISKDLEAALMYAQYSRRRVPPAEPKIHDMSREEWLAFLKLHPGNYGNLYSTAWEFYLSRLDYSNGRKMAVDAARRRRGEI